MSAADPILSPALRPGTPAVVLLSGGLDSTTVLALAVARGYRVHALSVRYGQRHAPEIAAARRIAERYGVEHRLVDVDLRAIGGSALTADIPVPKDRSEGERADGIPVTYVPARNTVLLAMALAWSEVVGAADIFIGVNAIDYSGYPDCRPAFLAAFERLAHVATKAGVEGTLQVHVHAPLIDLTKREIIALGRSLGVDYALTISCYDPDPMGAACGRCDACQLRLKGFAEAGGDDPAPYRQPDYQHRSLTPP
jgi:7-cyano-7-deazaguanine synthase